MLNRCDCCENTLDIGCINPCGLTIDFDTIIPLGLNGIWAVEVVFQRRKINFENEFQEGDKLIFQLTGLNENYKFTVKVKTPLGNYYLFNVDGVFYDCISFTTQIGAQSLKKIKN